MWLRDECNDSGYFPETENGHFNLENVPSFTTFVVEGPTVNGYQALVGARGQSVTSSPTTRHAGSLPGPPIFRSVVAHKKVTINVKVVKAKISRKGKSIGFEAISQMYIGMTEQNANINYVTEEVRKHWGEEFTIVSNDGIEIADTATTQGM